MAAGLGLALLVAVGLGGWHGIVRAQGCTANLIVCENQLPGTPSSVWDITGSGDASIQGFTTDISVNLGGTISFKVGTTASAYRIDIYRLGYYAGNGARLVTTILPSASLPQTQPACLTDSTGLYDCGNWAVSATWTVPTTAVPGVYIGRLVRTDTGGASHVPFVVRDDSSHADLLFQTSDTTWQAYNSYGGNSFYIGNGPGTQGNAYKLSYNRPFNDRATTGGMGETNWVFWAEYPMIKWLEANGYDVTYRSEVDTDRSGSMLLNHKVFLSVGHDEYWSANQRANVQAARDAGVHLAFLSGNEIYWKTRWENSIDGTNTAYRTLVCYKETWSDRPVDPEDPPTWTGTWRDPRFSPPGDGGRPENALSGTIFMVNQGPGGNGGGTPITVPAEFAQLRFWRNTAVASLAPGQSATLGDYELGYEWDADLDNGSRPAGLIRMSSTTQSVPQLLLDFGSTTGPGTATHNLTLYRAASGALVFGAGTVQWTFGLDADHDGQASVPDPNIKQAMVNLFADMGVQATTLQAGLVQTSASTDTTPPTSTITFPAPGSTVPAATAVSVTGTATDVGGTVAAVEVSTDGGTTWHPANGLASWSYSWTPGNTGPATITSRAVDDSGNIETPTDTISVNVGPRSCPCSVWSASAAPSLASANDTGEVELGMRFTSDVAGTISGVRFYKGTTNTGTHVGHLWSNSGTLLATATFTGETATGWQQANFPSGIPIAANTPYVISYYAPNGNYAADAAFFTAAGVDSAPLHALKDGVDGNNGVFVYGAGGGFPASTSLSTNYWVDVVFNGSTGGSSGPVVTTESPSAGATGVATSTAVTATFAAAIDPTTLTTSSFQLLDPTSTAVPAAVSYTAASLTAQLAPTSALAASTTYTAVLRGGTGAVAVKDTSGNPLSTDVSWTFTTGAPPGVCPCSIWSNSATPGLVDAGPDSPVELGVKFEASVTGSVTGVRFYKSAANTGTHVGNLWSSSGTLLATVTFTGETASGWQTASFPSPVAITANTVYVISYHTTVGHYSDDNGANSALSVTGVNSPPLQALADGASGPDGVYAYGSTSTFPSSGYNSSNYWVDLVFATSTGTSTPPTIASVSPANGATNVSLNPTLTATFSEAVNPSTVSTSTFELLDPSNAVVPATVVNNGAALTATLTPASQLEPSTTYTAVLVGGAGGIADPSGDVLASNFTWSFTTAAAPTCPCSLWPASTVPAVPDASDPTPVELGLRFRSDSAGYVTGVRFYKGTTNTGTHVGHLWTDGGTLLATSTFTAETASGWQEALFTTPVAIAANTVYVVSYFAPAGDYAATSDYFANGSFDAPPLHGVADGTPDHNGVYVYGASGTFPTSTYESTNYWVDVVFSEVAPASVTSVSPVSGATGVSTGTGVSAVFSSALAPTSVTSTTFQLTDPSNNLVAASVVYNASTLAATLTPTSGLAVGTTYTALLHGGLTPPTVVDAAGNPLSANVTWSFTTASPLPPPAVSAVTPASGTTGVAVTTTPTATFNHAMNAATLTTTTFVLQGPGGTTVPATVAYNSTTFTATLTPSSSLAASTTYTATIVGGSSGVFDANGLALSSSVAWTFTTVAGTPNLIGEEVTVTKDTSGSMTTAAFSTKTAGDLLVAFVAYDGPASSPETATVSGAGLSWTLASRTNTQAGTAEIWTARASGILTSVTVTSAPSTSGVHGSLTVIAFTNAAGIGSTAGASAATGTPKVALSSSAAGNWVFAVGNDWDQAKARTPASGQVLVHQRVDTTVGDTYWVQSTTAPNSTTGPVTILDTSPTTDRWNYAAVEIVATHK
jgi:hypothetical protein